MKRIANFISVARLRSPYTAPMPWGMMVVAAASLTLASGCGLRTYPVHGQLRIEGDSAGLRGYVISFESEEKKPGAVGEVQPDGSFRLTTFREHDGALAGKYRVVLTPPAPQPEEPLVPPIIDDRYFRPESTDLVFEVRPGTNSLTLDVAPAKTK